MQSLIVIGWHKELIPQKQAVKSASMPATCALKSQSRRGSKMHAKSYCDRMAQGTDTSKATYSWNDKTRQAYVQRHR